MGKIKKFASPPVTKITGGKDPLRMVEEFILRLGFDPEKCEKERTTELLRWMIDVGGGRELEILLEGLRHPNETTIYLGLDVVTVPLRGAGDILTTALEIADGLIGIKVSLVGHALVLSASLAASGITSEDIDYYYQLIIAQQDWFRNALCDELGLDELPLD
jgi:hypothetical protein